MGPLGIYIHIPFCKSLCPYCDFYKIRVDNELMEKYKEAVVDTTASFSSYGKGRAVDTIYFGGGTPSAMDGDNIAEIITAIKENFIVADNPEITVECNPSSDLEDFLPKVKEAGVNRISMGVQSAIDSERRTLGRRSDKARVSKAVKLIRDIGIANISLDLMLGVPSQTEESLKETLDYLISLEVPHISAYMLKIEEGTVFFKRQDEYNFPNEDLVCDMYSYTCETLNNAGIKQYEVSNFAKANYESRHNLKYWRDEEYLGIGPSAHSFIDGNRFYFEPNIEKFLNEKDKNNLIIEDGCGGDVKENLMLRLRLTEGVEIPFGDELFMIKNDSVLTPFLSIKDTSGGAIISLNQNGFLMSNTVISRIIDYFK